MKFLPFALLGLAMSTSAAPGAATPTSSAIATTTTPNLAAAAASNNSPVDAFVQCLWPTTDRIVDELKQLPSLSFTKFLDEIHYEIIWWEDPSKWAPDLVGIGLNATFVASCLLDVVGKGAAFSTTDLFNQFLKTFDLIPRNASNTAVPGL